MPLRTKSDLFSPIASDINHRFDVEKSLVSSVVMSAINLSFSGEALGDASPTASFNSFTPLFTIVDSIPVDGCSGDVFFVSMLMSVYKK